MNNAFIPLNEYKGASILEIIFVFIGVIILFCLWAEWAAHDDSGPDNPSSPSNF